MTLDLEAFECPRCGGIMTAEEKLKARRADVTICADCQPSVKQKVRYGDEYCRPWRGEFDLDTNTCLKNGQPYMVGERICGHADCVEKTHVIPAPKPTDDFEMFFKRARNKQALTLEQFDRSYRTGVKLTYRQFSASLRKEQASNRIVIG